MLKNTFLCVLAVILFFSMSAQAFASPSFELKNVVFTQDSSSGDIKGEILNTSTRSYQYVKFRLEVLDQYGNFINFISVVIKDFPANSSRTFCESFTGFFPKNTSYRLKIKECY